MTADRQALLNALKLELQFCENGGYDTIVETHAKRDTSSAQASVESHHEFRKERTVFQDSPWCLNYRLPIREHPCSACWLMHFVPPDKQSERVPCHHIPLNERGETLAALGGPGDAPQVQNALRTWLRTEIQKIESARET
jgi:hypothetical protein